MKPIMEPKQYARASAHLGVRALLDFSKELASLHAALTWRPCPGRIDEPGYYMGRWGEGEYEVDGYWLTLDSMPYGLTHIAGPLPLREGES